MLTDTDDYVLTEKLYESNAFRETLGRLSYVADRQMFAVVTADPGCGKSTLIRRFYSELPKEDYIVLYLSDSKLTPRWFYKGLLDQLGLESRFYRGDSKRQLQQEIEIIRGVQHKKVVCILDEAHLLEKGKYVIICTLPLKKTCRPSGGTFYFFFLVRNPSGNSFDHGKSRFRSSGFGKGPILRSSSNT